MSVRRLWRFMPPMNPRSLPVPDLTDEGEEKSCVSIVLLTACDETICECWSEGSEENGPPCEYLRALLPREE